MKQKPKTTIPKELILEMAKPYITTTAAAGLKALGKTRKVAKR
jgi:hypothetical protein